MRKLFFLVVAVAMFGESVCVSSTCTEKKVSELKPLYSDTAESVCMKPKGCVEKQPEVKELTEYENPLTWGL